MRRCNNIYLPNGVCTPGFRFAPTTHELVMWYLRRKVLGETHYLEPIVQIDIYEYDPWELPNMAFELVREELMWYFFCPEKKYGRGSKNSRTTQSGYWKGTGEHKDVIYADNLVAKRKTLVFHKGKSPTGQRTDWVMHQFCLQDEELEAQGINQESFVLCRVFQKAEQGPQNGAEYGAPFRMDMWEGVYRYGEAHPDLDIKANAATADNQSYFGVVNPNNAENAVNPNNAENAVNPTNAENAVNPNNAENAVNPNNAENAFFAINSDGTAFTVQSSLSYGDPFVPQSFASEQIYPGAESGVIDHTSCLVSSAPAVYSHPSTSEQVDTGAELDVIGHTSCHLSSPLAGYFHSPTYEQNYFGADWCVTDHTSRLASSSTAVYVHPSTSQQVYEGAGSGVIDHTGSLASSSPAVYSHPSTSNPFYTGAVSSATDQTSLSSSAPNLSHPSTSDYEFVLSWINQTPSPTSVPKVDVGSTKSHMPVIPGGDACVNDMECDKYDGGQFRRKVSTQSETEIQDKHDQGLFLDELDNPLHAWNFV